MSSPSSSPPFPSLSHLSLDPSLADEDLSLTLSALDDSFDSPAPSHRPASTEEFTYGGSMGVLPSPAAPPREEVRRAAVEEEEEVGTEGLSAEEAKRCTALREERDGLRRMNGVLETLLESLKGAEGKMEAFEGTIKTTHELLDLYVRLSSQAEHTQNLLLDRQWEGVTKDIQLLAAREAEQARLALERESQLREEAAAAALRVSAKRDEDARRAAAPTRGAPRGRASTRGAGSSFSSSNASGIGRGGPPSASARGSVTGVRGVRGIRSRVLRGGTSAGRGRGGE